MDTAEKTPAIQYLTERVAGLESPENLLNFAQIADFLSYRDIPAPNVRVLSLDTRAELAVDSKLPPDFRALMNKGTIGLAVGPADTVLLFSATEHLKDHQKLPYLESFVVEEAFHLAGFRDGRLGLIKPNETGIGLEEGVANWMGIEFLREHYPDIVAHQPLLRQSASGATEIPYEYALPADLIEWEVGNLVITPRRLLALVVDTLVDKVPDLRLGILTSRFGANGRRILYEMLEQQLQSIGAPIELVKKLKPEFKSDEIYQLLAASQRLK